MKIKVDLSARRDRGRRQNVNNQSATRRALEWTVWFRILHAN